MARLIWLRVVACLGASLLFGIAAVVAGMQIGTASALVVGFVAVGTGLAVVRSTRRDGLVGRLDGVLPVRVRHSRRSATSPRTEATPSRP